MSFKSATNAASNQTDIVGGVLVGIATYNEIENLPTLIERILDCQPGAHIMVVDDDSPDGTGEWCSRRSAEEPRLNCLVRKNQRGLGSAVVELIRQTLDGQYDWLVTMDGDQSHDPKEMARLLDRRANADVVIGSRYVSGAAVENWPWYRRCASGATNLVAGRVLRLPVRDCSSGYRCYRVAMLRQLDLANIKSTGYAFYEEVLWHLRAQQARFTEVPITFSDRTAGRSKAGPRQIMAAIGALAALSFRRPDD